MNTKYALIFVTGETSAAYWETELLFQPCGILNGSKTIGKKLVICQPGFIMANQWYIQETKKDYEKATARFEEINDASKNSPEYKEMLLLPFSSINTRRKIGTFPNQILLK